MNKSRLLGAVCACVSVFTAPQAISSTINTYFGWNYVASDVSTDLGPLSLPILNLNNITYIGAGGTITQDMNFGGLGVAMPDGEGLSSKPTPTYDFITTNGDGQSTRTEATSLPIDWIDAGVLTPWGSTYSFPTIGIQSITVNDVAGFLLSSSPYIVGLIPSGGSDTELDSALGGLQSDIYDSGSAITVPPDPASGFTGTGTFIFSAAEVSSVPAPAAVWLFGSGLIGLVATARKKKTTNES